MAKLQQKPYVVHISTFCFSLAPFSRPAPSRASGHPGSGTTSHLEESQDNDANNPKPVFCLLLTVPCLFPPYKGSSTRFKHRECSASHAPLETPRSFWKEGSPRGAVPSWNKKLTAEGWDLQDPLCTQEQLRRRMVTILSPRALFPALTGTSFGFLELSGQSWSSNQHPI